MIKPEPAGRMKVLAKTADVGIFKQALIKKKGPPVFHRPARVVFLVIVQARHVLAPVDEPGSHAVGRGLSIARKGLVGERLAEVVSARAAADAPIFDGGEDG